MSAAEICPTMQKLWFKSKRSQPLPTAEDISASSPQTEEPSQDNNPPVNMGSETIDKAHSKFKFTNKRILGYFSKIPTKFLKLQVPPFWLILLLGLGGIAIVTMLGLQYLTAPESTPGSNLVCKSKIKGDWQTPIGKITLQEDQGDLVSGKYEYTNSDRGKIVGELKGKLSNNVVTFDWQETPKQQAKQTGKGVLVFVEGCKEFYGSYGTGESTSNFGNWQGLRISK